jgi:ribosomal 30S subunit maturation factor RimM
VKVGRPHGLDGSFYVDAPVDEGERVNIGGRDFTVAERKGTDANPIIRLDGIDDRDAAESLRGERLTTGNGERATGNDEWLVGDLVGCEVEGLGRVTAVLEGLSCDVLDVDGELVPLVTDAVVRVDVESKVIEVNREFLGL